MTKFPTYNFDEHISNEILSVLHACEKRKDVLGDLENACLTFRTMSKFDGSGTKASQKYLQAKLVKPLEAIEKTIAQIFEEDDHAAFLIYRALAMQGINDSDVAIQKYTRTIKDFHLITQNAATLFKKGPGRNVDYAGRYLTVRIICCFQKYHLKATLTKTGQLTNIVSLCLTALGRHNGSAYDLVSAVLPVVPSDMSISPSKINAVLAKISTKEKKPGK